MTLTEMLERTIKNESVTLMHAVALARNASSLRLWTMAYRGTMYNPPKNEIAKRQAVTARFGPEAGNSQIVDRFIHSVLGFNCCCVAELY